MSKVYLDEIPTLHAAIKSFCEGLDLDPVGFGPENTVNGFRLMYEGSESGIHTLCVYYCTWSEHDVWGMERAKTLAETEIRFKKPHTLIRKLNSFVRKAA